MLSMRRRLSDLDVHLVLNNYGTHKTPIIWNWLAKRPRFYVHCHHDYRSWLNLVEPWFAALTRKQLRRGAHRSVAQLDAAIQAFIDAHHTDPKRFVWTTQLTRSWRASLASHSAYSGIRPRHLFREPLLQDTN
jgi:hypothetical protein